MLLFLFNHLHYDTICHSATDSADEVQVVKSCQEGRKTADKLIDEVENLSNLVGHELREILNNFERDLRAWVSI